jgi:hypothetical protein
MMRFTKRIVYILSLCCILFGNTTQPTSKQLDQMLLDAFQIIWEQAMEAKAVAKDIIPLTREELLENLSSSAPSVYFVTHADLSDSLTQAENTSASVFVSTDNQSSWIENTNVAPIDQEGYASTWGATTITDGGSNVSWYLSGSIDSGSLGLDFGQITVSQSPYNQNDSWPPSDNLYTTLVTDSADDTGAGQDIVNIRASYSDNKLYASMGLEGSCCDPDEGFFGPWNLYAIAIVNPESEAPVAYAYGYGDGGFLAGDQLYPAIYKIDGDLSTGEITGFEVLSENFNYSTAGNNFSATSLLSIIVNDADWGEWPNSLNGIALVGTTVQADVSLNVELLDNTNVGVFVMSTQSQNGNTPPVLSEPSFDEDTGLVSVIYTDADNNLAITHEVFVEDMAFVMIPDSHAYAEGVTFSAYVGGGSTAEFVFNDGAEMVFLELDLGGGGSSCQVVGDANGDAEINVLDVVLTVNLILCADCPDNYNECSDLNSDGVLNVLDVVSLVNIILSRG